MNPHPTNDDSSSEQQFTLHQVVDRQHGVVASVFEYPAAWEARSDVVWNFQSYNFPLAAYAQIYNPARTEVVEFLPAEQYFWLNEGVGFYVPGQDYYGTPFLVLMPAADASTQWVVPKYRGNRQGLRVVGAGPVRQLAQKLNITEGAGVTEDACVRVEYTEHGRLYEEELYGMKFSQDVPYYGPQGMMVQVNDPYYGTSQQDANWQYHWTNGSGEYQHSNDPFFNPNIGSNQNWAIMTPEKS
jgi:hypothetical protein